MPEYPNFWDCKFSKKSANAKLFSKKMQIFDTKMI